MKDVVAMPDLSAIAGYTAVLPGLVFAYSLLLPGITSAVSGYPLVMRIFLPLCSSCPPES